MKVSIKLNEQAWSALQARHAEDVVDWLNQQLASDEELGSRLFPCHDVEVVDVQFGSYVPSLEENHVEYRAGDGRSSLSISLQGVAVASASSGDALNGSFDFWSGLVSTL